MKILSLELTNVGKHRYLRQEFGSGLTVIRGSNEAGKTTMIVGMLYCLFGSDMLEEVFEEYVTRGEPKTSLKTKVTFQAVDGNVYECHRSATGAELVLLGTPRATLVTNHSPVTAKVEELLGVPPGKAATTIYAAQNEIRGVLGLGPTAAAQYIEKLADFNEVDALLKFAADTLDTGSTAPYEQQIADKQAEIATLENTALPVEDVASWTAEATALEKILAVVRKEIAEIEHVAEKRAALETEKDRLLQLQAERARLTTVVSKADGVKEKLQALAVAEELNDLTAKKLVRQQLEKTVADAAGASERIVELEQQAVAATLWDTHQRFLALQAKYAGGDVWDDDLASLDAERSSTSARLTEASARLREIGIAVTEKEKTKLASTICPFTKEVCVSLSDPAVVESTNSAIDKEIAGLQAETASLKLEQAELSETAAALELVRRKQAELEKDLAVFGAFVEAGHDQVPWTVSWVGSVPEPAEFPTESTVVLQGRIEAAKTATSKLEVLPAVDEARLSELKLTAATLCAPPPAAMKSALQSELQSAQKAQAQLEVTKDVGEQEIEAVKARIAALTIADIATVRAKETETVAQLNTCRAQIDGAAQREAVRVSAIARLKADVAGIEKTVETVRENNAFLKEFRAARLKVTDLLWTKVLGGTSNYFSRMRNEPSIVARTPKGFTINGGKVVSGSTMDILGLALRITVVKMFSSCGIMICDEANAGADVNRSAAMTATVSGAGFDQVFLITHKDVDESGCDHLIEL